MQHVPRRDEMAARAWPCLRGACDSRNTTDARGAAHDARGAGRQPAQTFQFVRHRISRPQAVGKNSDDVRARPTGTPCRQWQPREAAIPSWSGRGVGRLRREKVGRGLAEAMKTARIQLRLRELAQLFNSMDPSPFLDRDLDADAEEFIVSWAREHPKDHELELTIHLAAPPPPDRVADVEEAV